MARVGGNDTGNSNQWHIDINANIARIEAEIVTTKAHLAFLNRQLEEQKSLISPVRKTPVELLSAIFEICNGEIWESPLRLVGVCKKWSEIVLSTPLAWTHIDLRHEPPMEILSLYLERSNSSDLHLTLPAYDHSDQYCRNLQEFLDTFSDRISCLYADAAWICGISLFNLRRMRVRGRISSDEFTFLYNPRLHYLEASFTPSVGHHVASAPRIEHLCVWVLGDHHWVDTVHQLKRTLVALKIQISPYELSVSSETFDLPHLRYLELSSEFQIQTYWGFKASTPLLQSHVPLAIMHPKGTFYSTDVNVGNVTHLTTYIHGSLSLAPYRKLHYLRLEFYPINIMEELRMNDNLCPFLAVIEYKDWHEHIKGRELLSNSDMKPEVIQTIDRGHLEIPTQISVVRVPFFSLWGVKLPNEIEDTVRALIYFDDTGLIFQL
jgi:hypothetical protein